MPALSVIGTPTKRSDDPRTGRRGRASWLRRAGQPGHLRRQPGVVRLAGPRHHHHPVLDEHPARSTTRHPVEVAVTAGHIHEVSGGRFRLGLGVSHEPAMSRLGHQHRQAAARHRRSTSPRIREAARRPASCRRSTWRRCATRCSTSPSTVADGAIWANASRRHMPTQLARVHGRRPRRLLRGQHDADGDRCRPRCGAGRSTAAPWRRT